MLIAKNILTLAGVLSLSACAWMSPYSQVTKLDLRLTASDQLNPDVNGRPSPLVLRLIELKLPVSFQKNDFFSLYEHPKETLSPDFVISEEFELRPGTREALKLRLQPGSRYIGVLAAYRDLPETHWRYLIEVPAQSNTHVDLLLDEQGIQAITEDRT